MPIPESDWPLLTSHGFRSLEMNIGIFCGCLPVLTPLIRRLRDWRPSPNIPPFGFSAHPYPQRSRGSTGSKGRTRPGERNGSRYHGITERVTGDGNSDLSLPRTKSWAQGLNGNGSTVSNGPSIPRKSINRCTAWADTWHDPELGHLWRVAELEGQRQKA